MVRVITQETYDEVVKENIEEFDMTPEEAIKEAVAQFEAQGVNLGNIIKDLALSSEDNHLVTKTVLKLKDLCSGEFNTEEVIHELDVLKAEFNKDLARRVRGGKDGAYKVLIDLLTSKSKEFLEEMREKDINLILAALNTLTALMDTQPDLLESKGIDLMKTILDNVENEDILIATLKWISNCCIKHEMNRQKIFAKNIQENLKIFLNVNGNEQLLLVTLQVIRMLTLDDDIRFEYGKAPEHSKELGVMMLEPLKNLLKEHPEPPLVSELVSTLSCVLVRNELCAAAGDCELLDVLTRNYDRQPVVHQTAKLVTALAGNDEVKRGLVKKGIAPLIVAVLRRHSGNGATTALLLKSISALVLREPSNGRAFFDNGAPEVIVECMKIHHSNANVQKNGCWAIRNMVARSRDLNPKFLELGVESVLNSALEKFETDFGFDINSALRDLECDCVKLKEQWTGTGVQLEQ